MTEVKEPEVMSAADLKRKMQAGEDPNEAKPADEESLDAEEKEDAATAQEAENAVADAEEGDADEAGRPEDGSDSDGDTKEPGGDDASADAGNESEGKDKGRKKRKQKKKDPRDEKIAELNDKLLRNLAEFENFRNRSEKEKEARFDLGARSVVEKILPVIDNLERGIDGLSDEEKQTPFAVGIVAVYKQLTTALSEMGVEPIEAIGKDFDPNLHQAVMHEEDDSDEVNKVIEELQKGYKYKDTVVRYSMVKVLN